MRREDNYRYLFTKALHSELKDRVKGRVYCKVDRFDILKVSIQMDEENYPYEFFDMHIEDFTIKVLHGFSVQEAVYIVMKNYRRYINDKYFK